ncbi:uncharacterized protein LOC105631980 isoform X2 [Jatropha curcas]|uniref:uncharacterized protein LOC105631980 isoform X2 n=1 Tax=Jatropha curcas TaxID=180498 RepID=UPI0009D7099F|nr:uncharacterized protein LOC105631980 isoform X2 [Jatropha curcas]
MALKMAPTRPLIHVITLFLSLSLILCIAFAASGGRMGGGSFSKRSLGSSGSSSSHFSPPNHANSHYHNNYYHRQYHHGSSCFWKEMRSSASDNGGFSRWDVVIVTVSLVGVVLVFYFEYLQRQSKGSVLMVQVGLRGKARSLLKELNEIAETTDTSSPKGWQLILIETTSALLRHPKYFISGYSSVNQYWGDDSVEKSFRELSGEEREKTERETLVNVNNIKWKRTVTPKANKFDKDYIVVTVLVAAAGSYRVPPIRSTDDMKDALRSLNSGCRGALDSSG